MPYNEFGEYIPDDLALDEMKYELAKKGIMPLRPGGSDVPYVASEVPQTYVAKPPPPPKSTATNVPQAIADRLGLSAIPQAALGMISSFPAAVAKETGFPNVAEAIQYTPTSKMGQDVLEGVSRLPQVVTGSEMGVGPLAEFYVPRRAFGLEPRPLLSPDDVRVMGARAVETGREIRNVPEDFRAAQEGLRRESVFGGPTLGARTQGLFDEIGDVMTRREMQGLSPIPGIPDVVSPQTRMYAVRPANVGQMIDPTDLPTARYSDQNRKINTVSNMLNDVVPFTDFEYPHNNSHQYYNAAVRDAPSDVSEAWKTFSQNKINEMFPDAPNDSAAAEAYANRFDQKQFALNQIDMLSEFARSPEALSAVESVANRRDTLLNIYNEAKNKPKKDIPEDQRQAHEDNVEQLELEILKENLMPELSREEFIKRIAPPTKEEYMRRAQAAADYIQGTFKKDISKYIGTSQGPQMELAKRGITMAPKQELLEKLKQFQSDRGAYSGELRELEKERAKAGFNPKGEMYPLIVQKETEIKDLQAQLNELNRQKSELRDLHRVEMPDEPDAARNPTETGAKYRALTNPMNALIDKIEQTKKQLENFTLANAYETISDVAYTPVFAKTFKQNIPYPEKQFFPNLEKTPDEAQMFNVTQRELGDLGIPFLAEMIVKNIMTGRIPLDEKGKPMTSIDKTIEQLTKPRLKEESMQEAEKRKGIAKIYDYAQETLSKIPPDLRFKNSSVLELTKDSTEDAIRRQQSFDCMVLNHCIGATEAPHPGMNLFTGERQNHSYPVDPVTGKDRGDRKFSSSFMTAVLKGSQRSAHLRDNVTGLPVVTINMRKESSNKYDLDYVSGYGNSATSENIADYAADIKDYLNLRADIIKGPGSALGKWGILDTASNDGQRKIASLMNINSSAIPNLGLPRFVLENDIREMALQQPMGDTHADMVRRRSQLNDEYNRLSRERGEEDPEVQDLGSQIADITQRLQTISRQTVTRTSDRPNVFRRMSSEALTNGLQLEGRLDEVLDLVSRTINLDNADGLVDFWADDFEFFPERLRTFTNAIRNDENLQTMTAFGDDFNAQDRERLARFQLATRDFTPHQREVLVRELDRYAEANILQQIDNLNPDDPEEGQRQYEEEHPGVADYLEQISRRRRGEDFTPEARAQTAMRVPRDIADQIVPAGNWNNRDEIVQRVTEAINNSVRNLPEDRATLQEALAQYQRNPLDIPGSIEMILPTSPALEVQNENRRTISNYLIQQIQNRLGNQAPDQENQLVPEHIRGAITRDLNELMMLGRLNDSASILTGIFEGEGIFAELTTDEQRTAASDFLNATLRGLLNDPDYRPADGQRVGGNGPEAYRDQYTNEEMGSRRAFDQIIQAERMTPGAINEAIRRTDGRAMYDAEVMQFYNVLAPAGISQINNALRRYMEGNGFDVPPRPAETPATRQEVLGEILDDALETSSYNYPEYIIDTIQRDLDTIMTEGVRFDTNPDEFILRLNQLAQEAGATPTYATAINELASSLLYSYQQLPDTPGNAAPQLPAPAANPIDELERRYGEAPRAPIDIVTDGLNRPITQFERDYSEEVQDAYRQVLNEINPAPTPRNLQEAMSHLSIIHDMLEGGEHDPGEFNLTTAREMTDLSNLIERHFEVFREFENLLDGLNDQPPQGRKRGGFIERATGVRSYSDLKRDKFNRKYYDDGQAALDFELRTNMGSDHLGVSPRRFPDYPESDSSGQRNMGLLTPDFELGTKQNTYDQDLKRGGRVKKMNKGGKVNPVPTAARIPSEHPHTPPTRPVVNLTDPGFAEELKYQIEQRQKSSSRPSGGGGLTDAELKNRLGSRNPTYNAGGKVSIDQMRYELLRK